MGYVIVAVLAFALGVCVTLLGSHIRKTRNEEQEDQ